MNLPLFVARRICRGDEASVKVSRPAVLIAKIGVAVSVAVMIVTVAVVSGFKQQVGDKVAGFGAHLQLTDINSVLSFEQNPIVIDDSIVSLLKGSDAVLGVQRYSLKPTMVKTASAFQGAVLKGVGSDYDQDFLKSSLKEGTLPDFSSSQPSNRVVLSRSVADNLQLALGDKINLYFIDDNVRVRRLEIAGIYETNLTEFDNLYMFTDVSLVNRLNGWQDDEYSGAEVRLKDFSVLEEEYYRANALFSGAADRNGSRYCVTNIRQLYPAIFSWLDILDVNIWVILVLMIGIAGFTMISGLLIIIIERTSMIGLLKSQGASDGMIRRVFLWLSTFIILRGVLWGDVVGIGLCLVQKYLGVFRLDASTYYMDMVPVSLSLPVLLLLNAGAVVVSVLMLVGPSCLVSRISPATTMRYE